MHDTTELPDVDDRALSRPGMSTADRSRWMALVVAAAIVVAGTVLRPGD